MDNIINEYDNKSEKAELDAIMNELRSLADRLNISIVTAHQQNKQNDPALIDLTTIDPIKTSLFIKWLEYKHEYGFIIKEKLVDYSEDKLCEILSEDPELIKYIDNPTEKMWSSIYDIKQSMLYNNENISDSMILKIFTTHGTSYLSYNMILRLINYIGHDELIRSMITVAATVPAAIVVGSISDILNVLHDTYTDEVVIEFIDKLIKNLYDNELTGNRYCYDAIIKNLTDHNIMIDKELLHILFKHADADISLKYFNSIEFNGLEDFIEDIIYSIDHCTSIVHIIPGIAKYIDRIECYNKSLSDRIINYFIGDGNIDDYEFLYILDWYDLSKKMYIQTNKSNYNWIIRVLKYTISEIDSIIPLGKDYYNPDEDIWLNEAIKLLKANGYMHNAIKEIEKIKRLHKKLK